MLYNTLTIDVVTAFLPIVDNLEKAIETETTDEKLKQGIEMILKQFLDVFKYYRIEEIEAIGKTFNPEVHEAVSTITDEEHGEKEIVTQYRKGYRVGDKVIRHAMVVVAN